MSGTDDTDSYYRASANPHPGHPALAGEHKADVCIVGAGYTGLSAALVLAERGHDVAVLEAERVGFGASGRNGGQICTGYSGGMDHIEARLPPEDVRKCWDIAEDAKTLIRDRVARHAIDCDLTWGYLNVATKASTARAFPEWQEEAERFGYEGTRILSKAEVEERLGSTIYHGGFHEAGAGHLHPLNYCLGLADAAVAAGARIFENAPVVRVETGANPAALTAAGAVRAENLILAGNAYLGRLVPQLHRRIMPVGSYILATEPLGENRARSLIRDNDAVCDTNFIVNYYRLSADHRMLFGGRASYSTLAPKDLFAFMRPRLVEVFPQLDDVRLDYCWGGNIGITVNRIPHLGRIGTNVWHAQGYSGQGVALAGMCGALIAEAIAGTAERFDVLAKVRHQPFPGGPLRTPALVLAMLYYRLRDALG